jgi:hypothetical protein
MTALDVIKTIRQLPPQEQEKVRSYFRENLEEGQLPGEVIGALAKQMVESEDPAEKARLREEIISGFYGKAPHA